MSVAKDVRKKFSRVFMMCGNSDNLSYLTLSFGEGPHPCWHAGPGGSGHRKAIRQRCTSTSAAAAEAVTEAASAPTERPRPSADIVALLRERGLVHDIAGEDFEKVADQVLRACLVQNPP